MQICPQCHLQNRDDAPVCAQCRSELPYSAVMAETAEAAAPTSQLQNHCIACGKIIDPRAKSCIHCGVSFVDEPQERPRRILPALAIVISLVVLAVVLVVIVLPKMNEGASQTNDSGGKKLTSAPPDLQIYDDHGKPTGKFRSPHEFQKPKNSPDDTQHVLSGDKQGSSRH